MSNERLTLARESTGLSMRKFAEAIGVSPATISLLEKGERELQVQTAKAIEKEFGINETWLLTGEGDMKAPPSREQEIADMVSKLVKLDPNDEADQLMYDTLMHLKDVPKSVWEDFLQFIKEEIPKLNLK